MSVVAPPHTTWVSYLLLPRHSPRTCSCTLSCCFGTTFNMYRLSAAHSPPHSNSAHLKRASFRCALWQGSHLLIPHPRLFSPPLTSRRRRIYLYTACLTLQPSMPYPRLNAILPRSWTASKKPRLILFLCCIYLDHGTAVNIAYTAAPLRLRILLLFASSPG